MNSTWNYSGKGRFAMFAIAIGGLFGLVVFLIWNWLIPDLFGLPEITYWKAIGLLILSKILFGGFGRKGHHMHGNYFWKKKFRERWDNMTEEEREKYRNCWRPKD